MLGQALIDHAVGLIRPRLLYYGSNDNRPWLLKIIAKPPDPVYPWGLLRLFSVANLKDLSCEGEIQAQWRVTHLDATKIPNKEELVDSNQGINCEIQRAIIYDFAVGTDQNSYLLIETNLQEKITKWSGKVSAAPSAFSQS
jgi:hypothetical protein